MRVKMAGKILKKESLSKQVSDQLENMISSGEYKVGEKIPTEPELMTMFQVSRNTVREAIQSLTWAGLLNVKQGDGTYVIASDRFHANIEQKCQTISLDDIKEARNCLEASIAHLAALRRNDDDIECIRESFEKRKALPTDLKENTKADLNFHMDIARSCHNTILIDMYESIYSYLESQIAERNEKSHFSSDEIDTFHEMLFEAVLKGHPEEASAAVKKILEI